jgi:aspartate/methionine/tyrosine aminotransferase
MSLRNSIMTYTAGGFFLTAAVIFSTPLQAGDAGAFIGGVVATKVLGNMERRTQAEEVQAYNSSRAAQPVQQAAAPAAQSPQQKLNELDKLAAGGYITPEEYKARRKAVLDSM